MNEPGGRLFGEALRAPGERRKLFDWEVPLYTTYALAFLVVSVGLSSRPKNSATVRILASLLREVPHRVPATIDIQIPGG